MNKAISGLLILFGLNFLGEIISHFFMPIIPGSILGMLILFALLQIGFIKEDWVEGVVSTLIKNLQLLFLAPTVGIIAMYDLLKSNIAPILSAVVLSTISVLLVVGVLLNLFTNNEDSTK